MPLSMASAKPQYYIVRDQEHNHFLSMSLILPPPLTKNGAHPHPGVSKKIVQVLRTKLEKQDDNVPELVIVPKTW